MKYSISLLMVLVFSIHQFVAAQSVIYYIAPNKVDCMGIGPSKCYLAKKSTDAGYNFFNGEIEGFNYEEGYEYKISVNIVKLENTPADQSSMKYVLDKVLEKTKAVAVNTDTKIQQKWTLAKYLKNDKLIKNTSKAFIQFTKDARINGNSSCNNFFGSYTQSENTITFSQVGMTKMYCEGSIESDFITNLNEVNAYKIVKKSLYLYHDSKLLLAFVKAK